MDAYGTARLAAKEAESAIVARKTVARYEQGKSTNVDLYMLPLEAGQHSAAFGAFTMIASPGATAPQIVCVEDRTGIRYLEGPHAVDAHVAVFEHLCAYSLSPAESVDAIRTISKGKYQDE